MESPQGGVVLGRPLGYSPNGPASFSTLTTLRDKHSLDIKITVLDVFYQENEKTLQCLVDSVNPLNKGKLIQTPSDVGKNKCEVWCWLFQNTSTGAYAGPLMRPIVTIRLSGALEMSHCLTDRPILRLYHRLTMLLATYRLCFTHL
jgi:hypothetical protein